MPGGSYVSNGQQYATRDDLASVISAAALTHPAVKASAVQDAQLLRASEYIDGYLRDQFKLPLVEWGSDVVQACCDIAAYRLVCLRGFNPETDGMYQDNFRMQTDWLKQVANGVVSPDVVDASPSAEPGQQAPAAAPLVYSPNCIRRTSRR